jgi:hypothetical protein
MENHVMHKYSVLFTTVIAIILLLTVALAYVPKGGYVDLFLTATILVALITIVVKVNFISTENEPEQCSGGRRQAVPLATQMKRK